MPRPGVITESPMLPRPRGAEAGRSRRQAVAVQVSEVMPGFEARDRSTDAPVAALDGPGVGGHDGVGDRRPGHRRADGRGDRRSPVVVGLGDGQGGLGAQGVGVGGAHRRGVGGRGRGRVHVGRIPWPPEGTVPASSRVTDWPDASEARVQVSVAALKVTPDGQARARDVGEALGRAGCRPRSGWRRRTARCWRPRRCRCRRCRPRPS